MITAEEVIRLLKLEKHPAEGGYFRETYRCQETAFNKNWGERSWSTAIYYLLTDEPGIFSEMHRLNNDEVFHFYAGDPVEMLHLLPDGSGHRLFLGNDLENDMKPQVIVPGGVWQGCRLFTAQKQYGFSLLGTTVAPAFEYSDYEPGKRLDLLEKYPAYTELITALTRQ